MFTDQIRQMRINLRASLTITILLMECVTLRCSIPACPKGKRTLYIILLVMGQKKKKKKKGFIPLSLEELAKFCVVLLSSKNLKSVHLSGRLLLRAGHNPFALK